MQQRKIPKLPGPMFSLRLSLSEQAQIAALAERLEVDFSAAVRIAVGLTHTKLFSQPKDSHK